MSYWTCFFNPPSGANFFLFPLSPPSLPHLIFPISSQFCHRVGFRLLGALFFLPSMTWAVSFSFFSSHIICLSLTLYFCLSLLLLFLDHYYCLLFVMMVRWHGCLYHSNLVFFRFFSSWFSRDQADWSRALADSRFNSGAPLSKWHVVLPRRDEAAVRKFVQELISVGRRVSMDVQPPSYLPMDQSGMS